MVTGCCALSSPVTLALVHIPGVTMMGQCSDHLSSPLTTNHQPVQSFKKLSVPSEWSPTGSYNQHFITADSRLQDCQDRVWWMQTIIISVSSGLLMFLLFLLIWMFYNDRDTEINIYNQQTVLFLKAETVGCSSNASSIFHDWYSFYS